MGCASIPSGKYQALEKSSEDILTDSVGTFAKIEDLQRHFEVVVAPNSSLNTNSFNAPVVGGRSTDIVPELQFRENAIRTLVKYLSVLEALSAKDYENEVDKAAIELAGSLQTLERSAGGVSSAKSKNSAGVFATLTDVIGREAIREKRIRALRKVMHLAQGDVKTLCNLVAQDNDKISRDIDIMMDRIVAHANVDRPAYGTSARIDFDTKIAFYIWQAKTITESLKSIGAAVNKIPAAHQEIEDCLERKSSKGDGLKSLAEEAERANLFYRNLK
jgi:hypothetical protein